MKALAVILARGGSKGIPYKNLARLGGKTLLAHAIEGIQNSESVEQAYVSTEHEAIASEAIARGAQVIKRPAALATDETSSCDALLHAMNYVDPSCKVIVLIEATTVPHVPADIDRAVWAVDEQHADSAIMVKQAVVFLWKRQADGYGIPINQLRRARRQEAELEYELCGGCYVVRRSELLRTKCIVCGRVALIERTVPFVDIDEPIDLVIAEAVMRELGQ